MKSKLIYLFLFLTSLSSCVTFKQYDDRAKAARESSYEASITKNDETVITGKALKHKNHDPYDPNLVRVTGKDNAFTIDGKMYNDTDVAAFQDSRSYHKRYHNVFLVRLVKGKINLYYFDNTGYDKTYTFYSNAPTNIDSHSARLSYYFFDKGNSPILKVGLADLRKSIADNPDALKKLNSVYPKDNPKVNELNLEKLVSVVETYNR